MILQSEPEKEEALILLPGITADRRKKSHILKYYQTHTRYAVFLPELCQFFGILVAGRQLSSFLKRHKLENFRRCHFICYISGGFILRCALTSCRLSNLGRILYVRSPFQERVPKLWIFKYGPVLSFLAHGKMLFDLASTWKDELPPIHAEDGLVIEAGLTEIARRLGLTQSDFERFRCDKSFAIPASREVLTTPLSHDEVYSNDTLLEKMALFIESGTFAEDSKPDSIHMTSGPL